MKDEVDEICDIMVEVIERLRSSGNPSRFYKFPVAGVFCEWIAVEMRRRGFLARDCFTDSDDPLYPSYFIQVDMGCSNV